MAQKRTKGESEDAGRSTEPSFEEAMGEVEAIIEGIESGDYGLEDSITAYERGIGLLKRCREALASAEQRVEDLTAQIRAVEEGGGKKEG